MVKKITKPTGKKTVRPVKLSPEEQFWNEVEERSKDVIARLLDSNLPIYFKPTDLDLEKSTDWRVIARDEVPNYYEAEELPNQEYLAEEIAYHYLLTIIKRFTADLSEFACHDPAWFDNLAE